MKSQGKMSSVFSKIIAGELPAYKIAEDEFFISFLDLSPLAKGHALVVPKVEIDYLFDLQDQYLGDMMIFSKKVACAIKKVIPCARIGLAVIGLEVPHAHIHLVPINGMNDLNFANPKLSISNQEFLNVAKSISTAFLKG